MLFKNISTQKSYCFLTKTESKGKFASENVSVKGFIKNKMMKCCTFKIVFKLWNKYWICQKKRHGHSFASIHSIFNQKMYFHITFKWFECERCTSSGFCVSFFNKLFQSEKIKFWNWKKKYFKTLFLWKNGTNIIYFP